MLADVEPCNIPGMLERKMKNTAQFILYGCANGFNVYLYKLPFLPDGRGILKVSPE